MKSTFILCIAMCTMVYADIYFHNPRGSNNRLKGKNRERDNNNRMFDSQNNNRGGYNVGYMYYFAGSKLSLEWTNQHQCGGEGTGKNTFCDIVVQYMCSDTLRDGTQETTIPDNRQQCANQNCNTDVRYGMHEDYEYYVNCKITARNTGLFLADQELKGTSARYTRQNPDGTRRGYECPEERDHYPYWRPTPWKDIAILTNREDRCSFLQSESQNVKGKHYCLPPQKYREKLKERNVDNNLPRVPITKDECEQFHYPADDKEDRGVWTLAPSWGIPKPECIFSPPSRDNHLGNGPDGYPNMYNWTIPNAPHPNCALRIRYNISTDDYDTNLDADGNGDPARTINVGELVGLEEEEAKERGYVFENDPTVYPMGGEIGKKLPLAIALNTAQFGRTFEDRSHLFSIEAPTAEMQGKQVHNINVRGKRGNIVQTYPAVEYDFVPNRVEMELGDVVHFQWTGSDNNPNNNDGEGPAGQDRNNVALLAAPRITKNDPDYSEYGDLTRSYPEHLDNATFLGLTRSDLVNLALARGECERNRQGARSRTPYYDMGPRTVTQAGIYNYLCTINNNFTNRSQKGKIVVKDSSAAASSGSNGGNKGGKGVTSTSIGVPSFGDERKKKESLDDEKEMKFSERNLFEDDEFFKKKKK